MPSTICHAATRVRRSSAAAATRAARREDGRQGALPRICAPIFCSKAPEYSLPQLSQHAPPRRHKSVTVAAGARVQDAVTAEKSMKEAVMRAVRAR